MFKIFQSIESLPGVGPKRLQTLNKLGIFNINDLLTFFPKRYEDVATKLPSETEDNQKAAFSGSISSLPNVRYFGNKKSILEFNLLVENDNIKVTFFNQPWLLKNVNLGDTITVFGVYEKDKQTLNTSKILSGDDLDMLTIYPNNKEIQQKTLVSLIENAFAKFSNDIFDLIPKKIRIENNLVNRKEMIESIHFPKNNNQVKRAISSSMFEEFFLFQLRIQLLKQRLSKNYGREHNFESQKILDFIGALPFELTEAQNKSIKEILNDLKSPIHMNRLLQGDVGSGKTVVAAIAMLATVLSGEQSALMAPTEILATQHAKSISDLFLKAKLNIRVEVLTSSTKSVARKQILEDLLNGEIDILIGTHALIQKDVLFHNLGLAVIDEQHRFGVNQRSILREAGQNPDVLALTATPIPRTLAITAFGEMEVSSIRQLPKGRKQIKTFQASMNELDNIYQWIENEVKQNDAQAYIVTPLVEESEKIDAQNSETTYLDLKEKFPSLKIGLLHGRLDASKKDEILKQFKNKELDILVSTTVVEVGVDAPEATIMVVLDADRFGLSSLHQLRGRVGRNDKQSYAVFVADPKTEYGKQRIDALVSTTDGFVLAQKDLELRGPGDIIGIKQSGLPEFKTGDPIKNAEIMESAQQAAIELISKPNWEDDFENKELVEYLSETMQRYKDFD